MKIKSILFATALTALVLLSLTSVAYADNSIQMVGSQWAVYEQTTLASGNLNFYPGAHATTIPGGGGVEFQMPNATAGTYVNYLLNTYTANLSTSETITAQINVLTSSSSTAFLGNPDGVGCGLTPPKGICPGAVRLFIQSNLPADGSATCLGASGNNYNVNNYWWADVQAYTFVSGPGATTMSVPLTGAWSNICGQSNTNNPGFALALQNVKYVGLSFGSGYFFSNGLGVDGTTGTATFQLLSYTISS